MANTNAVQVFQLLNHMGEEAKDSWLDVLCEAAKRHLGATEITKEMYNRLDSVGVRRGRNFRGPERKPLFGLLDVDFVLRAARSYEDRITILLIVAFKLGRNAIDAIIGYKVDGTFNFASAARQQGAANSPSYIRWFSRQNPSSPQTDSSADAESKNGLLPLLGRGTTGELFASQEHICLTGSHCLSQCMSTSQMKEMSRKRIKL